MKNKANSPRLINFILIVQFVKYSCAITLFTCINTSLSQAQIWKGAYELKTQNEVDSFRINCNCTAIEGNLTILGNEIYNLDSLYELNRVSGNFDLAVDILEYVTDSISNENLNTLNGLSNLKTIGGNFDINGCNSLKDFVGLENLESVGGDLRIGQSTAFLGVGIGLGNERLNSLKGLLNIKTIGGSLIVSKNDSLIDIQHLLNLTNVEESIYINYNSTLTKVDGFEKLQQVGKDVYIQDNENLTEISGFNQLQTIEGDLTIEKNKKLIDWQGFSKLKMVRGNILVNKNVRLKNMDALFNLNTIYQDLTLTNNDALEHVNALSNITNVKGNLNVGDIEIVLLPIPIAIGKGNDDLLDLDGLQNLERIDGHLNIASNKSLKNANLNTLEYVEGNITFESNRALESLQLPMLKFVGTSLSLVKNMELSDCCIIDCLIDNEIVSESSIIVSENNNGCNTLDEIKAANCNEMLCAIEVSINDQLNESFIQLVPNPVHDNLTIHLSKMDNEVIESWSIYSLLGKLLQSDEVTLLKNHSVLIHAEHLPKGIYLLQLNGSQQRYVQKFMKI